MQSQFSSKIQTIRIAGQDRYETSEKMLDVYNDLISGYFNSVLGDYYVVSRGERYEEDLTAAAFAASVGATFWLDKTLNDPMVYTRLDGKGTGEQISANAIKRVVKDARANGTVKYLPETIFICTSKNFADALAVIPVIARNDGMLLFVDGNYKPVTDKVLASYPKKIECVYVIGGPNSISDNTADDVSNTIYHFNKRK